MRPPAAEPFEEAGIGQYHLRITVGVRHNVHANRLSKQVKYVDDYTELFFYGIKMGKCIGHLSAEKFRVDVPTGRAVQAGDYPRLPDWQNMNGILRFRKTQRIGNNFPETANSPDVDAKRTGCFDVFRPLVLYRTRYRNCGVESRVQCRAKQRLQVSDHITGRPLQDDPGHCFKKSVCFFMYLLHQIKNGGFVLCSFYYFEKRIIIHLNLEY